MLGKKPSIVHLSGTAGCGAMGVAAEIRRQRQRTVLVVLPDAETLAAAAGDLAYLAPDAPLVRLLAAEGSPYSEAQPDRQATMLRLAALAELSARDAGALVLVDAPALMQRLVPPATIRRAVLSVELEGELDISALTRRLGESGYLRVPVVEDPGSFSVRGGLVDVWGPGMRRPARIDLYGDMVASIKGFDPDSQRTGEELPGLSLGPVRETILSEEVRERATSQLRELCDEHNYPSTRARQLVEELVSGRNAFGVAGYLPAFYELAELWDYLPEDTTVLFEDPARVVRRLEESAEGLSEQFERTTRPYYPPETLFTSLDQVQARLEQESIVCCARNFAQGRATTTFERTALVESDPVSLEQDDHAELQREVTAARSTRGKKAVLEPLLERLAIWSDQGLNVVGVARTKTQARRLASLLHHRGISVDGFVAEDGELQDEVAETSSVARFTVEVGRLSRGMSAPLEGRVLITEEEIFGHRTHVAAPRKKRAIQDALEDLRALVPGDHVVHSEHGIGRYLGLENRVLPNSIHVELLVVEYVGGKLYLPVYRLNQIQKYAGGDSPKLDRLGGQTFAKSKSKARRRAREMADELLRLYAERNNAEREPLPPPDDDYAAFEAAFPFEETPDQSAAIQDVIADLQQPTVMDRLVCGDVGFGKTEVALRAAFSVASAGRQVAVLCPTTVLAQQHYLTFRSRLADTPFEVRVLSRFQSKKEVAEIISGLAKGSVDILIGTHRLLSKDVQFKELGLVVVDEEQRFGVTHKERLKQLRTRVDVLTLTATPIPRTLQLAIGGLRQMSIISTPPINRRAIRTIVARPDDEVLRDAIERELSRGGQVFYVYNRIQGLDERAVRITQLVPRARVAVAHGQMRESTLEKTMLGFVEGSFDVLVTTAIVESGLDIPRANTMLIDRADLFGLAQLYQLRGRVGRSQERAYCYLLLPAPSEVSDDARSRIEALERYTELGSGFQVATLDMELRGSGDLLGAEQSGPVATVGVELFCQMLEEATRELRGEEVVHDVDPDLHFDLDALLPDDYIEEVGVRLSVYKRLASARDQSDVAHVAAEMEDRFGPAPPEAVRLVELMRLKVELRRLKVVVCEATRSGVSLRFRQDTPLDAAKLAQLVAAQRAKYRLHPDGRLTRVPKSTERFVDSLELADKMLEELAAAARA